MNLQEARAVKRDLRDLVSGGFVPARRQVVLCDSQVSVAAWAKGRSSSFKLNGILRSSLPYMLVSGVSLALVWISTRTNPADAPSRGQVQMMAPVSHPGVVPVAPGLEVFGGSQVLTKACRAAGLPMWPPVERLEGSDVFAPEVEDFVRTADIGHLWLAPPCGPFTALSNLCRGGPLRTRVHPYGVPGHPEAARAQRGNRLWRRALFLARIAVQRGIPVTLEHPRGSFAWRLPITQAFVDRYSMSMLRADWCMYDKKDWTKKTYCTL